MSSSASPDESKSESVSSPSKPFKGAKRDLLILGHTGYIGGKINDFCKQSDYMQTRYNILTLPKRLDVTNALAVFEQLGRLRNTIIINCTGKTGTPNVDWCDTNKIDTLNVNICSVMNIISACVSDQNKGNYLIQVGSGCVYQHPEGSDGKHVFDEYEAPNFFGSFYSVTKAVCQAMFEPKNSPQVFKNAVLLRIRMPIDTDPKSPRNLVSKLLRYKTILCLNNSVTVLDDFMEFLVKLLDYNEKNKGEEIYGILNAVNPGPYVHKTLLEMYLKMSGDDTKKFEYIENLDDFYKLGLTAAGRSNCVLDTTICRKYGLEMPHVDDVLPQIVQKYVDGMKEMEIEKKIAEKEGTVDID